MQVWQSVLSASVFQLKKSTNQQGKNAAYMGADKNIRF
jgi:hypothetical protein